MSATGGVKGPYSRGDPTKLVDSVKGGEFAGVFYDDGKQFEVRLYPGEKSSGLFYYTLKETGRTILDEVGKTITDIGKEMARNPPFPPPVPPRGPQDGRLQD